MLPGDVQKKAGSRGTNAPSAHRQRVGAGDHDDHGSFSGVDARGVDRARFTTPSHIKTPFWPKGVDGGKTGVNASTRPMVQDTANPYVKMYSCRSSYYMGSTREQLQHYNQPAWATQAHPGCR